MAETKYSRYYTYIKPAIQNKIVRSYTPYIFSLISIIVFIFFAIQPTITTISNLQKSIEDNQKVLDALTAKSRNLSLGKQNLENLGPDKKNRINLAMPNQANISTLIVSLQKSQNQASSSALQIQPVNLVSIGEIPTAKTSLSEIDFSYSVSGSYNQLLEVLKNLNNSPRIISINSVSITKQEDSPTILSINGKAYYLK